MSELTERLAAAVPNWGVKLAYGPKETVDGAEILPVAIVGFGFGAGELASEPEAGGPLPGGSGGGGGGASIPVGVYVRTGDRVRFRPNPIALATVAAPVIAAIGGAIASIVFAARR